MTSRAASDPFLFDTEQLFALADRAVINAGLQHSKEHRVTSLECAEHGLWAEVEDAQTQAVLALALGYDSDGNLLTDCPCGEAQDRPCVHAIAALFSHGNRQGTPGQLGDALEQALEERVARGRAEVRVEPVAGTEALGTWHARSISGATHFPRTYSVSIRSLERRGNHCTCPDFATNQLCTCKHVEAVLHRIRKRKDFKAIQARGAVRAYVFLDWDGSDGPTVRLHRPAELAVELADLLARHFDSAGRFTGRLPDDFLGFAETVKGRGDLDIGADALEHARLLADDASRERRARDIGERIQAGNGHIPGIAARLYPYQSEGVAFLAGRGRALLADDMGLGKTLQSIAAAWWLHRHEGVETVLIVCPASLKQQWAREIKRFTGTDARIVQGPAPERAGQYAGQSAGQSSGQSAFVVINYELVLRDLSIIAETLSPDLLILDEAQRIKNWRTKIATAIKRIPSRYAFVLSGTPLENRLEDLYSLMQVVDPRVLGPLWRYLVDFHITDERGKVLGYRNLSELRRRLRSVMLRRDRSLVSGQLPARIDQRLDVGMTEKQQELHADGLNAAAQLAQIAQRRPLTASEQNRMMAALQKARMACNAAGLVDQETEGSPKLDELQSLLEELCLLSGLKAVVFSQWARMTEMVEQRVRRMGLGSVRLHGGVPSASRGALIDRFRDDDQVRVFISTDAGGTGLNLQNASVLINLDVPWNPAVLEQRIARVHRLGQTQPVQAILLVAADSYEERVLGLVQGKRELFNNVVHEDAGEDVVGITKRLAEVLAEDLAPSQEQAAPERGQAAPDAGAVEPTEPAGPEDSAEPSAEPPPPSAAVPDQSEAVRQCLLAVQQAFGSRIERVLTSQGGLLVVLDQVDDAADRAAAGLSDTVGVALIDARTLAGLARLGPHSPIADASEVYAPAEPPAARADPLGQRAAEKLRAAELLLDQGCPGSAAELLVDGLLAATTRRAGEETPPARERAGVWLYGSALPGGQVGQDDAALLMRGLSLVQAGDAIPAPMLQALATETRAMILGVWPEAMRGTQSD